MYLTYTPQRSAGQSKSVIPMPSHDGPQPEELRTRRLQTRFAYSPEVASQIAALAYGVSEKLERHG